MQWLQQESFYAHTLVTIEYITDNAQQNLFVQKNDNRFH